MNKKSRHTPPRWADRLLEWYCRPEILEDLQGDLHEFFDRDLEDKGLRKARLLYVLNVFKFIRLYTIKKPKASNHMIPSMLGSYVKTSARSIARNKVFSAINVLGLAISMSVCLLMISILLEVRSYDRFLPEAENIYRLNSTYESRNGSSSLFASTSIRAGKRFKNDVPGIASSTIITASFNEDFKTDNQIFPSEGIWADDSFFKVLGFELLYGNPETALSEPFSIVLTDQNARKIFNREQVLGEMLQVGDQKFIITGIVKSPPFHSHLKFDHLGSFITLDHSQLQENDLNWMRWTNIWQNYVYFKPQETSGIKDIQAALTRISEEENQFTERTNIHLSTQPMLDIVAGKNMANQIGPSFGKENLWILGGLALAVILSAGFNYTNLSLARALRRTREVGVRKVTGASNRHVFSQFTVEAILMAILSLGLSFFLFLAIKPIFLNLNPEIQEVFLLENTRSLYVYFLLFAIAVGCTAGFVPSLLLSRINTLQALKGSIARSGMSGNMGMKKMLMVIQFTLSLTFIISARVAYQQFRFSTDLEKGFNSENILNIDLEGNDPELIKSALASIPGVADISMSSMTLSTGGRFSDRVKYEDPTDSAALFYSYIDNNYLSNFSHELIAGSNFRKQATVEESEIIVNESLIKRFKIGSPQESIGQRLEVAGQKLTIVGVIKDFHYATVEEPIESFGFRQRKGSFRYLNVRISQPDHISTLKTLERAWTKVDPAHPFNAQWYDERIDETYSEYHTMSTIGSFLALISVSIAALGLLGMGIYVAETRMKEISVRKILGAKVSHLVRLLSSSFLVLLILATVIALPLSYYILESQILTNLTYRVSIDLVEILASIAVIFVIALLATGAQIWRTANANPATTLRND